MHLCVTRVMTKVSEKYKLLNKNNKIKNDYIKHLTINQQTILQFIQINLIDDEGSQYKNIKP